MFTIISRSQCNFCDQAKAILGRVGLEYQEFNLQENSWLLTLFREAGQTTVPQVYGPSGDLIGGYKELEEFICAEPD